MSWKKFQWQIDPVHPRTVRPRIGEKMASILPLIENDEIRIEHLNLRRLNSWLIGGALMASLGLLTLPSMFTLGTILIVSSFFPTTIYIIRWLENRKIASALSIVATDIGHPWHPSDEDGDSSTYFLDVKGEWIQLPQKSRIQIVSDPFLKGWTVRDDDDDEKLHGKLGPISEPIVELLEEVVNQALILTRTITEDDDPTLRNAREREKSAEGMLERTWMDTTPGQVEIQFGQMGRAKEILGRRNEQLDLASDSEE